MQPGSMHAERQQQMQRPVAVDGTSLQQPSQPAEQQCSTAVDAPPMQQQQPAAVAGHDAQLHRHQQEEAVAGSREMMQQQHQHMGPEAMSAQPVQQPIRPASQHIPGAPAGFHARPAAQAGLAQAAVSSRPLANGPVPASGQAMQPSAQQNGKQIRARATSPDVAHPKQQQQQQQASGARQALHALDKENGAHNVDRQGLQGRADAACDHAPPPQQQLQMLPPPQPRRVREDENTVVVGNNRYTKLECIGKGGSSKVFKVWSACHET